MNKVILIGRLTRDPELRMAGGSAVCNFSIAAESNYTNKNGERAVEFINCSAWGRTADNISKYCTKGSLLSVEGRIRNSSYTAQDGSKRYTTEVVAEEVRFLGSRNASSSNASFNTNDVPTNDEMPLPTETADLSEDPFKSFSDEITLTSDDLPF